MIRRAAAVFHSNRDAWDSALLRLGGMTAERPANLRPEVQQWKSPKPRSPMLRASAPRATGKFLQATLESETIFVRGWATLFLALAKLAAYRRAVQRAIALVEARLQAS